MVDASDFAPMFLATTLPDLQTLGAIYWRQSHDQGGGNAGDRRTGRARRRRPHRLDAGARRLRLGGRAISATSRSISIPNDGWVPHAAAEVLHNGYGDCKDHVVLMQAMLAALGIRAEAALIDWGTRTRDLPLLVPQFNHAIVYLPDYDRFANPTNPYARFDSLDRMLAGKTVVLATPQGEVTRTPAGQAGGQPVSDGQPRHARRGRHHRRHRHASRRRPTWKAPPRSRSRRRPRRTIWPSACWPARRKAASARSAPATRATSRSRSRWTGTWHSPHAVTFGGRERFHDGAGRPGPRPAAHLRALLADDGPRKHPLITAARDFHWSTTLDVPPGLIVTHLPEDVHFQDAAGSYTATYERTGRDIA